jgi:dipeptidase D
MSKIIEYFKQISQIPHCSYEAKELFRFLVDFANQRGYDVQTDSANNILVSKLGAKLCLQAHYDMVCMGKAPQIELIQQDNILRAKESSLGADNGIAIAMMMDLIDSGYELEFLFTSDEEVGLIGASALEFDLQSKYMLNLDSEDEAEVYIGCAGGADIVATFKSNLSNSKDRVYELSASGFVGGHSGVDIDKNIPSAIKALASYMSKNSLEISSIYAGQRRNAIPSKAVAIVCSNKELHPTDEIKVRELNESAKVLQKSLELIKLLDNFKHGVIEYDSSLDIPRSSINLAMVNSYDEDSITIECSARAMSMDELDEVVSRYKSYLESFGCEVEVVDKYPAWKPEITPFARQVEESMKKVFGSSSFKAIHAGLECGVIAQKYPHMQFTSIGPNIRYPHSTREEVDLDSVDKIYEVLKDVIEKLVTP